MSLWFTAGEAGGGLVVVSGVYADRFLRGEFLSATTWAEWKAMFPDTKYVRDR